MRRLMRGAACAGLLLLLSACMMGHRHRFVYVPDLGPDLGGGRAVVVFPVEDRRRDIVSGDEGPDWVGEQRNKYGIPFDVNTAGRRPFAEIVQETVAIDLEALGFRTVLTPEEPSRRAGQVARVLRSHDTDRGIAIVLRTFNSNTYFDIDVEWDLEAVVYGPEGEVLAKNRIWGKRELQGSILNPPKAAKRKVPPFFNDLVHELVGGSDEIVEGLSGPEPAR